MNLGIAHVFGRGPIRRASDLPSNPEGVVGDLFVGLLLIVAIVGASTGAVLVGALSALALVITIVARVWARLSLEEMYYTTDISTDRAFIGDELELVITFENKKPLPVPWVRIVDYVPEGLMLEGHEEEYGVQRGGLPMTETTSLGRYERVRLRRKITARRRGHYSLGPASMISGDLFGLYGSRIDYIQPKWRLIVYPRTVPLPDFFLPAARPIGDARSPRRVWDDPTRPNGVREYRAGDPVRTIDWKTTARRNELYIRTYDPSVSQYAVILLEGSTTERPWEGFRPHVLEAAVTGAASVAMRALELGYRVGLVSNGIVSTEGRNVIPTGRGPSHLPSILESLAMVRQTAFRRLEETVANQGGDVIPFGATFIYIAGIFRDSTVEYVTRMARRGHPVVAIWVGDGEPPKIPGIEVLDHRKTFADPEAVRARTPWDDPDAPFRRPGEMADNQDALAGQNGAATRA